MATAETQTADRFRVYGADSVGTILDRSGGTVTFRYDHAPDKEWTMRRDDFQKISYPYAAQAA